MNNIPTSKDEKTKKERVERANTQKGKTEGESAKKESIKMPTRNKNGIEFVCSLEKNLCKAIEDEISNNIEVMIDKVFNHIFAQHISDRVLFEYESMNRNNIESLTDQEDPIAQPNSTKKIYEDMCDRLVIECEEDILLEIRRYFDNFYFRSVNTLMEMIFDSRIKKNISNINKKEYISRVINETLDLFIRERNISCYPKENKKYKNDIYEEYSFNEQPFYRKGITNAEARKEMQYLNENIEQFFSGNYIPLWKQSDIN